MTDVTLHSVSIFNENDFKQRLSDKPDQLLQVFKEAIQSGDASIQQAFEGGADTLETVNTRAIFIDQILNHSFDLYFADCEQKIALVAVGGYGRAELHPASDIDIMLLLEEKETSQTENLEARARFS